jgi:hypothetical protein
VSDTAPPLSRILKTEAVILAGMLFLGIVLLPIAIWFVGNLIFGAYGGSGYGDFFGGLASKLLSGNLVAWFLVLSPWLALQVVRVALIGWRHAGKL